MVKKLEADDVFDRNPSYRLSKKDLKEKSSEELDEIQQNLEQRSLALIHKAEKRGDISAEAADFLRLYYINGASTYKEMRKVIREVLGQDEYFEIVDPSSKEVILDKDESYYRHVTPNTCAKFKIPFGENNNPLIATLPGMKNVERAIEKLNVDGKYKGDISMVKDIFRISISCKRLEEIERVFMAFMSHPEININPDEIKDKFCQNDVNNADDFTENNFRNKVFFITLPSGHKIEVQLKLTALEMVDDLTHKHYEEKRRVDENPDMSDEEKRARSSNANKTISLLNRWGIEKYNQKVLEKVVRYEEECKDLGIMPDENGMYPESIRIIKENFLARPKQMLVKDATPLPNLSDKVKEIIGYNKLSKELKHLFRDASPQALAMFKKYNKYIIPFYRGVIENPKNKSKPKDKKLNPMALFVAKRIKGAQK